MTGWTAADLPEQRGRTIVVTGATSGLGLEATLALVGAGARVVMACRNLEKARSVAVSIAAPVAGSMAAPVASVAPVASEPSEAGRGPGIEVRELDLADLSSVRSFAERLAAELGSVDVLVNNAGVMAVPYGTTVDGFELHLGTNHVGPFLLTRLLLGSEAITDRVVTVTSGLHVLGRIPPRGALDGPGQQHPPGYNRWLAYAQSKLANVVFAYELQRRLTAVGSSVVSLAAHPGVSATEGQRRDTSLAGRILAGGRAQPPARGALPLLYAAAAPDVVGGTCIGPDGFAQRQGYPTAVRTSRASGQAALAARWWERSEEMTGLPPGPVR